MKPRLSSIEEKNALLKSVTGRGTDKSESVLRSWNAVSAMLEDHKSVMKEQVSLTYFFSSVLYFLSLDKQ